MGGHGRRWLWPLLLALLTFAFAGAGAGARSAAATVIQGAPLGSLRYTLAPGRRARHTVRLRARAHSALRASGGRLRAVPVTGAAQTVRVARVPAA